MTGIAFRSPPISLYIHSLHHQPPSTRCTPRGAFRVYRHSIDIARQNVPRKRKYSPNAPPPTLRTPHRRTSEWGTTKDPLTMVVHEHGYILVNRHIHALIKISVSCSGVLVYTPVFLKRVRVPPAPQDGFSFTTVV